jgi:hypothetical protein
MHGNVRFWSKADICGAKRHVRFSVGVSQVTLVLICPGLESGGAAQESCVMLLRVQFNHYCEVIGRTSAFVAFVTMASLILAATAVDVLLTVWNRAHQF